MNSIFIGSTMITKKSYPFNPFGYFSLQRICFLDIRRIIMIVQQSDFMETMSRIDTNKADALHWVDII